MTSRLPSYLNAAALATWGGVMLAFWGAGRLSAYVAPAFQPLAPIAGVLLLAAAVIIIYAARRASLTEAKPASASEGFEFFALAPCCDPDTDVCTHESAAVAASPAIAVRRFLVLTVPILIAAFCTRDAFGENLVRAKGAADNLAAIPAMAEKAAKVFPKELLTAPVAIDASEPAEPAEPGAPVQPPKAAPAVVAGKDPFVPSPDALRAELPLPGAGPSPAAGPTPPPPVAQDQLPGDAMVTAPAAAHDAAPAVAPATATTAPINVEVTDLIYAAAVDEVRTAVNGRTVIMTGQVFQPKNQPVKAGTFQVVRFVMTCCASDTQPVVVTVRLAKNAPTPKVMEWVEVTGTARFDQDGAEHKPVVDQATLTEIAAPKDPFLY